MPSEGPARFFALMTEHVARLALTRRRKPKPPVYWFACFLFCFAIWETLRVASQAVHSHGHPFFIIFTIVSILIAVLMWTLMRMIDPEDSLPVEIAFHRLAVLLVLIGLWLAAGTIVFVLSF